MENLNFVDENATKGLMIINGQTINLFDLSPRQVSLPKMVKGLQGVIRFNGYSNWSVAQHSFLLSHIAERFSSNLANQYFTALEKGDANKLPLLEKLLSGLGIDFTEIKKDYPDTNFETNDLTYWKNQGVLLVNSSLTVEAYNPMSHKKYNWDTFVINLLNKINKHYSHIIYVAFGNVAKNLLRQVNLSNQYAIATSHPSPLGYAQGFKDSHIFKKINDKLISLKKTTIDWSTKISEKK